MSRICDSCGKKPRVANNVSNARNRTKKWVYPNVHRMRFNYTNDPSRKVHSGRICTRCVRSNKIQKIL